MGFPIGYTEVYLPKFLIYILTVLGLIRKLISNVFRSVGLADFLEPEFTTDPTRPDSSSSFNININQVGASSGYYIRELLPVVKYSELVDPPESCAVCLYEFDGGDEIRRLRNCRHVFHRSCLDRWMDHDQNTCPLCRTPFISDDLWVASGVGDLNYGEASVISY